MTRINTNVSSLNAQKSLARSNVSLQEALTRLSTGLRINVGKDDPAGLIASEMLRSDIISVQRAITNSERANQMIATADSSLGQVSALLNDIRGLITEAANTGALSAEQIAANQLQVDSSLESLNRIAQTTSFQGKKLLDGTLNFVSTAGSVASILDIQIDQANLGATGQIAVDVDIATAATQATIRSASGDAAATATLSFAPGAALSGFGIDTVGIVIDIKATALGTAEDNVTIDLVAVAAGGEGAVYDKENNTLTISFTDDGTDDFTSLVGYVDALDEWDATLVSGAGASTLATGDAALTFTTGIDSLTITAATAGAAFNDVEVSVIAQAGVTAANYFSDTKRLVITVDSAATTLLTAIETEIDGLAEFDSAVNANGPGRIYGGTGDANPDIGAIANTGITGYQDSGFSAPANATATLDFLAGAELSGFAVAATLLIDINAVSLGTAEDGVTIALVAGGNNTASYDSEAKVLTIDFTDATSTANDLIGWVNALDEWDATLAGGTAGMTIAAADAAAVDTTTGTDSLTISAAIPGADYNNLAISLDAQSGLGATPTAVYNSTANTLVISIDDASTTNLSAIDTAIDGLTGFFSASLASGTGRVVGSATDINAIANTGVTGGNVLLDALVLEIGGADGAEAFNFLAGASANQVAAAVNLVSDATGVSASQSAGLLTLTSTAYGSSGLVYTDVIDEGTLGTFDDAASAARANGTDIDATVNGISATGDGNELSINTATLDLAITVTAGSSTDFEFAITGGGALFQMGPDVVSNQQARLGIGSVNAAQLRGVSGRLYQIGMGQSAELAADPTTAARIVDEVITKVTSLRGRLGAFQRTTVDTNIKALTDTLENLSGAESSIRDADFAAETAALTRAQILVQSGVSVLAIANSNPQNVLALLR